VENNFLKINFQIFYGVYLSLEKLVNRKYFSIKEKFDLISKKLFSFLFSAENTYEKFRNIILFADYIQFHP
jgi:hypothetical protein